MKLRYLLVAGVVAVVGLIPASSAVASTLNGGANPRITAGAGEQNEIVFSGTPSNVVITDTAGITLVSAPECTPDTANQVSCNALAGNWQFLVMELKDMNDRLTFEPTELGEPPEGGVTADGGSGDDRLDFTGLAGLDAIGTTTGGRTTSEAWGGAGDDTLIGSQGGNLFDSSNRSDVPPDPNYDAGDDTLIGGPVADLLVGGKGVDFVDGRDGPDNIVGFVIDNQKGTTTDDRAVDTLFCGPGAVDPNSGLADVAQAGVGDAVGTDCEAIFQRVVCPPTGAVCDGTPQVTTTTKTRSGSAAVTARTIRRKVVLGRALDGRMTVKSGRSTNVFIPLRKRRVNRALGERKRMTVTFSQNFDRLKNGRKVGEANKRKRFKMRRR